MPNTMQNPEGEDQDPKKKDKDMQDRVRRMLQSKRDFNCNHFYAFMQWEGHRTPVVYMRLIFDAVVLECTHFKEGHADAELLKENAALWSYLYEMFSNYDDELRK